MAAAGVLLRLPLVVARPARYRECLSANTYLLSFWSFTKGVKRA